MRCGFGHDLVGHHGALQLDIQDCKTPPHKKPKESRESGVFKFFHLYTNVLVILKRQQKEELVIKLARGKKHKGDSTSSAHFSHRHWYEAICKQT